MASWNLTALETVLRELRSLQTWTKVCPSAWHGLSPWACWRLLLWRWRYGCERDRRRLQHRREPPDTTSPATAYEPFTIQYPNPQYLFFFPAPPGVANRSLQPRGPADRRGIPARARRTQAAANGLHRRRFIRVRPLLEFNNTTITGYLNQLQTEYFFINAGVPSWNSTQELFRVAFQIMDYNPALVIAYDGANDAEYHAR